MRWSKKMKIIRYVSRRTGHHGVILSDSSKPVLCFRCIMAGNRIMKPMASTPERIPNGLSKCQFLPFLACNAIMAGNHMMKHRCTMGKRWALADKVFNPCVEPAPSEIKNSGFDAWQPYDESCALTDLDSKSSRTV